MTAARTVVIGGGIVGAAVAYHLAVVHGRDNIVVIDQGPLPHNAGSTSHAPGGVIVASHSKTMARMAKYSAEMYRTLEAVDGAHNVVTHLGGVELARTPARYEDFKRLHGECAAWDIEARMVSPAEIGAMFPHVDPSVCEGGLFVADHQIAKGYQLVGDLLRKAEATGEVVTLPDTPLRDIEVEGGRVAAVITGNPDHPRIPCDEVVLAANIWTPAISAKMGVTVPLMAFEHQYAITPHLDEWAEFATGDPDDEVRFPVLRDVDVTMYYRSHWSALGIGSYYHAARMVRPQQVGATALRDFTDDDFIDAWKLAQELMPLLREREPVFETAYNGMFAFSIDAMPIIGESSVVRGLWSANASWLTHGAGVAKSVAEWMVGGDTEWDMRECHLHRFPEHATTQQYIDEVCRKNYREIYDVHHPKEPLERPRNLRLTPFHQRHIDAGAQFTTFAGFELPNWYTTNAGLADRYQDRIPHRSGWGAMHWSPIQGGEHLAARDTAGLWDLTGLSIIELVGPGAVTSVGRLCANEVDVEIGKVVYTCWLTPGGGVRRDLTVTRLAVDRFWMFVGEGTLPQDLDWVQRNVSADTVVIDRSAAYSALGVFGPNARDILSPVTNADLGPEAFRFYEARLVEIAMTRVLAMRISYVGELGWELHIPIDASLPVWDAIVAAGADHGLVLAGAGAMDSMRLEKGYRLWGGDVHTEYTPYEAGLGWTVKLDKGDFIGKTAAAAALRSGSARRLVCLTIDDPAATLFGNELVTDRGTPVGHITTANYGYSVGVGVAYAYVPVEMAVPGTELTVSYFDQPFPAVVAAEPLFDPKMARMRA